MRGRYDVAAVQTSSASSTSPHPFTKRLVVALVAALVAGLGTGVAFAQVGASWPQFQGGAGRTGVGSGPTPGFREAWRSSVEPAGPGSRYGLSAPVVSGDLVVAVGPELVLGFDPATGEQVFSVARGAGPSVPAAIADAGGGLAVYTEGWGEGPPEPATAEATDSVSPSPDEGADDDDGAPSPDAPRLAAFTLETQDAPWRPVELDDVSRTGVTIDGDLAFVGTNRGTVYAVDLTDGSIAWQREFDALLATSIAVADGSVLIGLQGDRDTQPVVVALDVSSGEERWRHEPDATSAAVSAVSAVDGTAYAIFSGLSETRVEAIAITDGAPRWSRRLSGAFDVAPPLVGGGAVVVTDLIGHTRALDAADGTDRWDFAQNVATFRGVPALIGNHVLVPSRDGELGAIDLTSGELVWRGEPDGAPMHALAPAGDVLVVVRGGSRIGVDGPRARPRRRAPGRGVADDARLGADARIDRARGRSAACPRAPAGPVAGRPPGPAADRGNGRRRGRSARARSMGRRRGERAVSKGRKRSTHRPPGVAPGTKPGSKPAAASEAPARRGFLDSILAPRTAGSSSMPRIRTSVARGITVVAGTPALAVGAAVIVIVEWLGALALGYEGPFALFVTALALPPVGTSFDATLSTSLFGLQGGFFAILGFVALASRDPSGARRDRRRGAAIHAARTVDLDPRPAHPSLALAVGMAGVGLLTLASLLGPVLGPAFGLLIQLAALVGGIYLLSFAPVIAADEGRSLADSMGRSVRAARMPGAGNLTLAAIYVFLSFALLRRAVSPAPSSA